MVKRTGRVELPAMNIQRIEVKVVGDSPLICHAWSAKAKKQMLDKQMKKPKLAKEAKDPDRDFQESLYKLNGDYGFPARAFKEAAVSACRNVDGIPMTLARGAFHVMGDLLPLKASKPVMREDMVRIGMGTADIRYRGEFRTWSLVLPVRYNPTVLSAEQIVNLLNVAGFAVGVGEWRPEKNGSNGMFHVAREGE